MRGLEIAASAGIRAVQTANPGSNWAQLPNLRCSQVVLQNNTGTAVEVRYCDAGTGADLDGQVAWAIADGTAQPLRGISTAAQVKVRRVDQSNAQVTLCFIHEGV